MEYNLSLKRSKKQGPCPVLGKQSCKRGLLRWIRTVAIPLLNIREIPPKSYFLQLNPFIYTHKES